MGLTPKVRKKALWTLRVIEDIERVPEIYFKHLQDALGLHEIRVQSGTNIFRIFCFFDDDNLIIICHGFQKKSQKTPATEIERAIRIKKGYYEEKEPKKP